MEIGSNAILPTSSQIMGLFHRIDVTMPQKLSCILCKCYQRIIDDRVGKGNDAANKMVVLYEYVMKWCNDMHLLRPQQRIGSLDEGAAGGVPAREPPIQEIGTRTSYL